MAKRRPAKGVLLLVLVVVVLIRVLCVLRASVCLRNSNKNIFYKLLLLLLRIFSIFSVAAAAVVVLCSAVLLEFSFPAPFLLLLDICGAANKNTLSPTPTHTLSSQHHHQHTCKTSSLQQIIGNPRSFLHCCFYFPLTKKY